MRYLILAIQVILFTALVIAYNHSYANAQSASFIVTFNPGASHSDSRNPVSPANIAIPIGSTVKWINKDSTPHFIASGTPEKGRDNIFQDIFIGANNENTITFDKPGFYPYYDPLSGGDHIRGEIIVENPKMGYNLNDLTSSSIKDNSELDSKTTYQFNPGVNDLSTFKNSSFSSPSSHLLSTLISYIADNTHNQSSLLSSLSSNHIINSIFKKVGPILGLLKNATHSLPFSLSSLSSFLSSSSLMNNSQITNDFDNNSSFSSYPGMSIRENILSGILKKVGPILSLLNNDHNSMPDTNVNASIKTLLNENGTSPISNSKEFVPSNSSGPISSRMIQGYTYYDNKTGLSLEFSPKYKASENLFENRVTNVILMDKIPLASNTTFEPSPWILLQISPKNPPTNEGIAFPYGEVTNMNNSKYMEKTGCKQISSKSLPLGTLISKEIHFNCPYPFNRSEIVYQKALTFEKNNFQVVLVYSAYSKTMFDKNINEFNKMIQSIQFK